MKQKLKGASKCTVCLRVKFSGLCVLCMQHQRSWVPTGIIGKESHLPRFGGMKTERQAHLGHLDC